MDFEFAIWEILLHALTAVGILEWAKHVSIEIRHRIITIPKTWYAWLLPVAAVGVGFSTLYDPAMIILQVWAVGQLAYPLLVQLPKRVIDGKSE